MTSWLIRLVSRERGIFGQHEANAEFDLETETHLQLLTERFIRHRRTITMLELTFSPLPVYSKHVSTMPREK